MFCWQLSGSTGCCIVFCGYGCRVRSCTTTYPSSGGSDVESMLDTGESEQLIPKPGFATSLGPKFLKPRILYFPEPYTLDPEARNCENARNPRRPQKPQVLRLQTLEPRTRHPAILKHPYPKAPKALTTEPGPVQNPYCLPLNPKPKP